MAFEWTGARTLGAGATRIVGSWIGRDRLSRGASVMAFVRDRDPQCDLFRSGRAKRLTAVSGPLEQTISWYRDFLGMN